MPSAWCGDLIFLRNEWITKRRITSLCWIWRMPHEWLSRRHFDRRKSNRFSDEMELKWVSLIVWTGADEDLCPSCGFNSNPYDNVIQIHGTQCQRVTPWWNSSDQLHQTDTAKLSSSTFPNCSTIAQLLMQIFSFLTKSSIAQNVNRSWSFYERKVRNVTNLVHMR